MQLKNGDIDLEGGVPNKSRKTIWHLQKMKDNGEKISQVCPRMFSPIFTECAEMAGVDIVRVTVPGENAEHMSANTPWWVRELRAVAPVIHMNVYLNADFYADKHKAVEECAKLMWDGADSFLTMGITLEVLDYLALNNVPVFGHAGILSGWQVANTGGYRKIGKTAEDAMRVFRQAYEYQEHGMKAMTIEMTPREVSHAIAKKLRVPVINIAGSDACDGSELVMDDMLKMIPEESLGMHAKVYGDFYGYISGAFKAFSDEVKGSVYPEDKHGWTMDPAELDKFMNAMEKV
jgi:3-methyl-2-oxobutanoate hydroxymethyltransferase